MSSTVLLSLEEQLAEVEQAQHTVDVVSDVSEELESVAYVGDSIAEQDSVPVDAVDTITVAVESILNRVGVSLENSLVVTKQRPEVVESDIPNASREFKEKLASIWEWIKKTIKAIVSAIGTALTKVLTFLANLTKGFPLIKARLLMLRKKAESLGNEKQTVLMATSLAPFKEIMFGGEVLLDRSSMFFQHSVSKTKLITKALDAAVGFGNSITKDTGLFSKGERVLANFKQSEEKLLETYKSLFAEYKIGPAASKVLSGDSDFLSRGVPGFYIDNLPGGYALAVVMAGFNLTGYSSLAVYAKRTDAVEYSNNAVEVKNVSKDSVLKLIDEMLASLKALGEELTGKAMISGASIQGNLNSIEVAILRAKTPVEDNDDIVDVKKDLGVVRSSIQLLNTAGPRMAVTYINMLSSQLRNHMSVVKHVLVEAKAKTV